MSLANGATLAPARASAPLGTGRETEEADNSMKVLLKWTEGNVFVDVRLPVSAAIQAGRDLCWRGLYPRS